MKYTFILFAFIFIGCGQKESPKTLEPEKPKIQSAWVKHESVNEFKEVVGFVHVQECETGFTILEDTIIYFQPNFKPFSKPYGFDKAQLKIDTSLHIVDYGMLDGRFYLKDNLAYTLAMGKNVDCKFLCKLDDTDYLFTWKSGLPE